MRTKVMLLALGLAVVLAIPASAQNSLTVTAAAAQDGTNFGLQVNHDGASTNTVYVHDDSPTDEGVYTYTFWLHPGTLQVDANSSIRIGAVGDDTQGQHVVHFLRRGNACNPPDGCWFLNTWVKDDSGVFTFFTSGIFLSFYDNPLPHQIQVEWVAGSGSDGVLRITRLTGQNPVVREVTTRDTDTLHVDNIRWGSLAGSGTNASAPGAYFFDEFVSTR